MSEILVGFFFFVCDKVSEAILLAVQGKISIV